ncbi:hypothetical protein Pint_20198 [Pistacia integerrima]|uniref:Uncharacterized protein n=1 Tax=Pistacia integerrima TaxID=434235 RepID=A0ACC0XEV4_9ROSI|nr:hypothetical protein Pint_20198 [Pistacia integerrima]
MDYQERAKRQEAAPLIEAAFQRRSVEEKVLHERDQQAGVRLATETKFALCSFSEKIPGRVLNRCKAEFDRRRVEREERINQIIQARKQEREVMRKKTYYVRCEDERMKKLREEEGARKWEADVPAKPFELPARASEPGTAAPAAAAPSAGKYVPRFVRERTEGSGQSPPTQPDWCGVRPKQNPIDGAGEPKALPLYQNLISGVEMAMAGQMIMRP